VDIDPLFDKIFRMQGLVLLLSTFGLFLALLLVVTGSLTAMQRYDGLVKAGLISVVAAQLHDDLAA